MADLIVADSQIARAELDVQITTAKAYPRSTANFISEAIAMATVNEDTAESCFYKLQRTDKDDNKSFIEGPSVRLAEIAVYCWGNLHAATRIIGNDGKFVTAEAVAWDLEKNNKISSEVKRSILTKKGYTFSQDMQVVTANAAAAIAFRNAVFKVLPRSFVNQVYEAAKKAAVGDQTTKEAKTQRLFKRFNSMGIKSEKILGYLGKAHINEVTLEDIETLIGIGTSIKEGLLSIDNAFSTETQKKEKASNLNAILKGEAQSTEEIANDYFQESN